MSDEVGNGKGNHGSGGGYISYGDHRVSRFIAWGVGALGAVSLALGGVAVSTLVGLRDDVRDLKSGVNFVNQANADRAVRTDAQINELKQQVNVLTQQVYALEGRVLRGLQEGKDLARER